MSLEEIVELLIANFQYNIVQHRGRPDLEHEEFMKQDRSGMLDPVGIVLKPDGHGYIFFSTFQFVENLTL